MKLYGSIAKVEEQDDGTIMVYGVASSGARDDAGELITPDAMKAALPDYASYPALREMHGLSAAGRTLEASVDSDGLTRIVAHVVDPIAITKVKTKTYAGFSIGGKVLERDKDDRTIITKLKLSEISLVDRPCNPEAVLDMWKADGAQEDHSMTTDEPKAPTNDEVKAHAEELAKAAGKPANWRNYVTKAREALIAKAAVDNEADTNCGNSSENVEKTDSSSDMSADTEAVAADPVEALNAALEKAKKAKDEPYGDVTYADPGYQEDGKKRYPLDTEKHIRAAWSYINKDKNQKPYSSDQVDKIKAKIVAAWKSTIDKDGPPSAEKMASVEDLEKTAKALRLMIARGDGVLSKGLYSVSRLAELIESLTWLQQSVAYEADCEADGSPLPEDLANSVAALLTCLAAMVTEEAAEIVQAYQEDGLDIDFDAGDDDGDVIAYASSLVDLAKADEALMQKVGARHSKADAANMQAAHDALAKLGAMCDPNNVPAEDAEKAAKLTAENDRLAKALTDAVPQVEELRKAMTDQGEALAKALATIEDLSARLEKVEATPAAPKAIKGPLRAISKSEDVDPLAAQQTEGQITPELLQKALMALTPEQRASLELKAALSKPLILSR